MKSFFATIAIAGVAAAECWSTDDGYGQQCDDEWTKCSMDTNYNTGEEVEYCYATDSPLENTLEAIEDAYHEIVDFVEDPRLSEYTDDLERAMEDLECWWASRDPVTTCHQWEMEKLEQECDDSGLTWNYDTEECMTSEEYDQWEMDDCYTRDGDECTRSWKTWDGMDASSGYCEYTCPWDDEYLVLKSRAQIMNKARFDSHFNKVMKGAPQSIKDWKKTVDRQYARVFSTVDINARIGDFDDVRINQEELNQEAEDIIRPQVESLADYLENWGAEFESSMETVNRENYENYEQLANLIIDSVTIDDIPLRDITGDPESWMMARVNPGQKNVMSLFALDKVIVMQEDVSEEPTYAHVTIDVPSEEEAQAYLDQVMESSEAIKEDLEALLNSFLKTTFDAADQLGEDGEEQVVEPAMDIINEIGDKAKNIIENETEVVLSLAQKSSKKAESHDYTNATAGVVCGALLFGAVALMVNNRKKTTVDPVKGVDTYRLV